MLLQLLLLLLLLFPLSLVCGEKEEMGGRV
jgi:hypothetical protein